MSTYESALLYLRDLPWDVLIDKIKSRKLEDWWQRQELIKMDSRNSLMSRDLRTSIASSVFDDDADPFLEVELDRNGEFIWEEDRDNFNNNFEVSSNYMS